MTPEEYQQAQASLATLNTEMEALKQERSNNTQAARRYNDRNRQIQFTLSELEQAAGKLQDSCAPYIQEVKERKVAQAKAEAEARAKAKEEAKAMEVTEIQKRDAEIAALKAQLEAKG